MYNESNIYLGNSAFKIKITIRFNSQGRAGEKKEVKQERLRKLRRIKSRTWIKEGTQEDTYSQTDWKHASRKEIWCYQQAFLGY